MPIQIAIGYAHKHFHDLCIVQMFADPVHLCIRSCIDADSSLPCNPASTRTRSRFRYSILLGAFARMKHKGHHVRCRPVRASLLRCKMLSFDLSIHVMHQFSPTLGLGHAARTGEASNPGPGRNQSTCLINIAIANPTSIVSRRQTFADILANENLQILCLAETSATLAVQKRVQKDMGTLQCKSFWSNPVTPMRTCQDGNNSLRGRTGGTAVFAKTPMRMCRNPLPNEWMSTTRLVHTIAQIGQTNFQLITLYSIPQSHANAKEYGYLPLLL